MSSLDTAYVGHSTNLVGIPTGLLASVAFNEHPLPLHISGTLEANPALLRMLAESSGAEDSARAFQMYMAAVFSLDHARREPDEFHRFHASYRQLLHGWGFDSNGPQGAVLKGWVESRFGLIPTFHKQPLGRFPSAASMAYLQEKMSGRYHNNAIQLQLDLLFEFCQWTLAVRTPPACHHLTLYRGVNDFEEHHIVARTGKRTAVVRLNNLVSFSDQREVAEQFGDTILEVRVPLAKILLFKGLLSGPILSGEGEHLVLGGDYRVTMAYY